MRWLLSVTSNSAWMLRARPSELLSVQTPYRRRQSLKPFRALPPR